MSPVVFHLINTSYFECMRTQGAFTLGSMQKCSVCLVNPWWNVFYGVFTICSQSTIKCLIQHSTARVDISALHRLVRTDAIWHVALVIDHWTVERHLALVNLRNHPHRQRWQSIAERAWSHTVTHNYRLHYSRKTPSPPPLPPSFTDVTCLSIAWHLIPSSSLPD